TQRAVLYRNGIPIAITTVSTGRPGHRTPTGVFTVLERDVEHYSSLYNAAPMPFMQRITWGGVALHGGDLPGYPASHGCIRLPREFARLLFGVTRLGMTVVITSEAAVPRLAPAESLLRGLRARIKVSEEFRREVEAILRPGTTVVITEDSLRMSSPGHRMMVLEGEAGP